MPLPNFLIIGAPKAGTTAMYKFLRQHPQIFMPENKEPGFFAYRGKQPDFAGPGDAYAWTNRWSVVELEAYQHLFDGGKGAISLGEATTMYLYWPPAAQTIKQYVPDARLIAILRNPVDRAFSHYRHLIRDVREPETDFLKAMELEDERVAQHYAPAWHYRRVGLYAEQIQRYFNGFDREQMRIYLYDDFKAQPMAIMQDILKFLEVDADWLPDLSKRHNTSEKVPKYKWLNQLLTNESLLKKALRPLIPASIRQPWSAKLYRQFEVQAPEFQPHYRQALLPWFKDDILALQDLIHRDLSVWLAPN
jgi:hypothetical protein